MSEEQGYKNHDNNSEQTLDQTYYYSPFIELDYLQKDQQLFNLEDLEYQQESLCYEDNKMDENQFQSRRISYQSSQGISSTNVCTNTFLEQQQYILSSQAQSDHNIKNDNIEVDLKLFDSGISQNLPEQLFQAEYKWQQYQEQQQEQENQDFWGKEQNNQIEQKDFKNESKILANINLFHPQSCESQINYNTSMNEAIQICEVSNNHLYYFNNLDFMTQDVQKFDYWTYYQMNQNQLNNKISISIPRSIFLNTNVESEEQKVKRRDEYCEKMKKICLSNIKVTQEEGEIQQKEQNVLEPILGQVELTIQDQNIQILKDQIIEEISEEKVESRESKELSGNKRGDEIVKKIDEMKICNKKNVVKNIMNAFKNFILEAELKNTPKVNQQLVQLYNAPKQDEEDDSLQDIIKKFKRYINSKNFNHYSMRLLIIHPNYGPVLQYFLKGPIFDWAKNCKANDLEAHFVMVDFLLLSFTNIKFIDELKRHEKKKAHYQ